MALNLFLFALNHFVLLFEFVLQADDYVEELLILVGQFFRLNLLTFHLALGECHSRIRLVVLVPSTEGDLLLTKARHEPVQIDALGHRLRHYDVQIGIARASPLRDARLGEIQFLRKFRLRVAFVHNHQAIYYILFHHIKKNKKLLVSAKL